MGSRQRPRVLFLASYFPKPGNPQMGTWALAQAQALAKQDIELQVVSYTSWVPRALTFTPGAKAYANCPTEHTWPGKVSVLYPRWLYYPVQPLKNWAYAQPIPYLQVAWRSAQLQLQRIVQTYQPDLVFCHHGLPNGWGIAKFFPQLPLVTQEHDLDEITDCNQYPQRRAALQTVVSHSRATLTVGDRMTRAVTALYPHARAITHHMGIEAIPDECLLQERPPELQGKVVILCCALFAVRKGGTLLVEAFARIANKYPSAILRIVGSGPDWENIRRTIERLQLGAQVQIVGPKPHAEVLQEMVWADAFALVGWDEPFGVVYLEAMAAGKPVICCNDGGINDLITDGVHGLTVPPKDTEATAVALERILSGENQRIQMGQNGRRLVLDKCTWNRKAEELLGIFEMVLKD
jgi:glycosyltransferase involved in cell wall biosynthesis